MDDVRLEIPLAAARQQPEWRDRAEVERVRRELRNSPGLVAPEDVRALRSMLATVAVGHAQVVQTGDCAEDPSECASADIARKASLLDVLAGVMNSNTHQQVVRVGRIAGQYAKPRSRLTERSGEVELPVYRGHMVNSFEPDPVGRQPEPRRMLAGYRSAAVAMKHLGWSRSSERPHITSPVWTSHEALLLDYEVPMVRRDLAGNLVLTSTHWPWIGERTRQLDGPHVGLLAAVTNPVACKVGPKITVDELLALCARLDPNREPGRLTLIARLGADAVEDLLPPMVTAVREAGHPVVWLIDPMHGNTITTPRGIKTRLVGTIIREVRGFQRAIRSLNGHPGGLHLETTPDFVVECVASSSAIEQAGEKYTTLCDPRLNPSQALSVALAWE